MPILDHFTDIFFFNFIMTHSKYKEKALTPPKKSRTTVYPPPLKMLKERILLFR